MIPPKPGPPVAGAGRRQFLRRYDPAPNLGPDRDVDAVYVLDSGVGLSFAHVAGGLELLHAHYGDQLRYVEDVSIEWRTQAAITVLPLEPGHSVEEKRAHTQLAALVAAAKRCVAEVPARFGNPVDLGYGEVDEVDALITELCALHPPRADDGGDRGECASVRLAEILRKRTPVVVLCSNDDRGRRLAGGHGVATRNAGTVLREMVREQRLDAGKAFTYYQSMLSLSGIPQWALFNSPADFR